MKKISIAQIRKHEPCYDPTEIEGITEKTKMSLLDWINYKAEKLTDEDKVWLFAKFGTNLQRRKFAIWCARQCKSTSKEIKKYIDTAEKYYIYKTATKKGNWIGLTWRLTGRLTVRLIGRHTRRLIGRLIGQLIGRLSGRLTVRLKVWLTMRLTVRHTAWFTER